MTTSLAPSAVDEVLVASAERPVTLPRLPVVIVFSAVAAAAAVALPLLTYTVTLAAFGLAHVLAELRYVDQRFGPGIGFGVRLQMLTALGVVVVGRGAVIAGWLAGAQWQPVELVLVALLALTSLPRLLCARPAGAVLAVLMAGLLATGAAVAPMATLLVLAIVHNITPAGFLAERLRGSLRWRALAACAVLVALAGFIATGWPTEWLAREGWWRPEFSVLPSAGTLDAHLGQYVPPAWQGRDLGINVFSAAVFLQCLHYGAVLHVLPRLGGGARNGATVVRWPRERSFLAGVAMAGILLFGGFLVSFSDARALYSLAAAVHAWIEIPLLLLALAPPAAVAATITPMRTS